MKITAKNLVAGIDQKVIDALKAGEEVIWDSSLEVPVTAARDIGIKARIVIFETRENGEVKWTT